MATLLQIVIEANALTSILFYIPLLINLKYWYQTKIRDYLFIAFYFLATIIVSWMSYAIGKSGITYLTLLLANSLMGAVIIICMYVCIFSRSSAIYSRTDKKSIKDL